MYRLHTVTDTKAEQKNVTIASLVYKKQYRYLLHLLKM